MNGEVILKEKIGVVFQENTFDEELSIYENMMLRGRLYGITKKVLEKHILELSRELGMDSFLFIRNLLLKMQIWKLDKK